MIDNPVIFYIGSFLIIAFALLTIFAKNIINSLLFSIMVFFSAAILFYILGSEYNAIIQAAIYGFAVPIIIGLSIMFTTGKNEQKKENNITLTVLMFSIVFLLLFIDTIVFSVINLPDSFRFTEIPQVNSFDVISSFAKGIFINYVFAFELISLLLTVVIAGFTIFRRKRG